MVEVLQPNAGVSICDWASGSGGLLLQCIRYVKKHGGDVRQLQLHGQESNVATYNISRINMILHGIPVWEHKQGDSLRDPRHVTTDTRFSSAGLLTDDAMGFIGSLVQVLKRRHYKPSAPTATGDEGA